MRCLARLIRCAIVASGTRNAAAISAVREPAHRPQRQRDRRARGQRRMAAQEQQPQRVVPIAEPVSSARRRGLRLQQLAGLLPAAARVVGAPDVDQPAGRDRDQPRLRAVRQALLGPRSSAAASSASWTASSAVSKSRYRRATTARTRGASSRSRSSTDGAGHPGQASAGGGPMIGRTSIGMPSGAPPTPGAADALAAIS